MCFLFTLPKVAPLHSGFSLSIFRRKIVEIYHAVIPSEVVTGTLSAIFQFGHVSLAALQTMIENEIIILCSICTLIFVSGEGGDVGPVTDTCASAGVKTWSFEQLLLQSFASFSFQARVVLADELKIYRTRRRFYSVADWKLATADFGLQ